jgi:hypothetical protein
VLYKIALVPLGSYSQFMGFFVSSVYVCVYAVVMGTRRLLGIMPPGQASLPLHGARYAIYFLLIGLCDAVGYVLGVLTAGAIPGPLLPLLSQTLLPFTIVLSAITLGRVYSISQLLSAAFVIGGVLISLVHSSHKSSSGGSHDKASLMGDLGAAVSPAKVLIFKLIYAGSSLFSALSFVLKEAIFARFAETTHTSLDVFVVSFHGSFAQLIFTFASLLLVSLPVFGGTKLSDLGHYFVDGFHCFAGTSPHPTDDCTGAPLAPLIYMAVNLGWNVALIFLLKHGSALFMFIGISASIPLAEIAFAFSWPLLGASPMHREYIYGLVLIMVGLVGYRVVSLMREARAVAGYRMKWTDCI